MENRRANKLRAKLHRISLMDDELLCMLEASESSLAKKLLDSTKKEIGMRLSE